MRFELGRIRVSDHDIHLDPRSALVALEVYFWYFRIRLEAAPLVVLEVIVMTALKVALQSFSVSLAVALFSNFEGVSSLPFNKRGDTLDSLASSPSRSELFHSLGAAT